ncbi:hypothetical protein BCAR13_300053 [Paraburkholderia caribensis]|nr:hypothetical protein BCAR13_300053 [Paraburkholderia caribensis]
MRAVTSRLGLFSGLISLICRSRPDFLMPALNSGVVVYGIGHQYLRQHGGIAVEGDRVLHSNLL